MLVIGPSPLSQDRTCISGQTCTFPVLGEHLTWLRNDLDWLPSVDQVLVLDSCGAGGSVVRAEDPDPFARPRPLEEGGVAGLAHMTWNEETDVASGGQYRLCWCAAGFVCNNLGDFVVDLGRLTVNGPEPTSQHRTCVAGQTCVIDDFLIRGQGDGDRVMIMDTCGSELRVERAAQDTQESLPQLYPSGLVSWGDAALTAAGGTYQLCWCSGQ